MITTPTRLRIVPNAIIQIKRRTAQGRSLIKVHPGYEVDPDTILGEGQTILGYKIIELAKILGVRAKDGQLYLKKRLGQNCYSGELIAEKKGFLQMGIQRIIAASDGSLDSYDNKTGQLKIKLIPKREMLMSGVYGVVDKVDLKKAEVLIRTQATIIFGVAGSGREKEGTLHLLSDNSGLLISSRQISSDFSGSIIIGGSMVFADALQKCVSLGIGALITGGINASDFRTISGGGFHLTGTHWTDAGITVLVTEGFGSAAIGDDIYNALRSHEGHFCLVDGNNGRLILPTKDQNSMMYIRKTAVQKNHIWRSSPVISSELKVGSRVRVVSADALGSQGIVSHIDLTPTVLPTGQAVIIITIESKGGKKQIALENIEIC